MGTRTHFFLTAVEITFGAATALASVAIPYAMFSGIRTASLDAPTNDQIFAQMASASAEMRAVPLDDQIDNWYLKSRAYLHCTPPEREYRDAGDGFRDRNKVLALVGNGRCKLQYGREPPPACGYGTCYAIAALILSTVVTLGV